VITVWSVTRAFPVPQLLLPPFDLQVVVTDVGPLPLSNVGVTVAETPMEAVDRSTGEVAVTPVTLTDGKVAANAGSAISTPVNNVVYRFMYALLLFQPNMRGPDPGCSPCAATGIQQQRNLGRLPLLILDLR
jgi:hypothetical protein